MAWDKSSQNDIGQLEAAADLSAKQYFCVAIDNTGKVALVAAAGGRVDGILQNAPQAGEAATFRPFGTSKAVCGGTVTAGDLLKSDANGKVQTASAGVVNTSDGGSASDPVIGSYIVGKALASGVAGDIIPIIVLPGGVAPTTPA